MGVGFFYLYETRQSCEEKLFREKVLLNKRNNSWIIGFIVIFLMGSVFNGIAIASEKANVGKEKIDAKHIIETVCTKCHNINRIIYSPDRDVRDWVQIIAFANRKEKFITKEQMVAVIEWLQVNRKELRPAPVDIDELTNGFEPAMKEFLVKNKCLMCHTGDRIQQKAGLLSVPEWKGIMYRMKLKSPDLLKDMNTDKAAEFLSNFHTQVPDDFAESVKDIIDKLETDN